MTSVVAHVLAPTLGIAMLLGVGVSAGAQHAPYTVPTPDSATLRVFVDHCPCRLDYVRQEIPYVDYVRDRDESDVQVLFTDQHTGGGGRSYTITFIGHRRFAGQVDTMQLATPQGITADEVRRTLVRYLKLGLVPYLNHTRAVSQLDLTYAAPPDGEGTATPASEDPWNFWVFRTNVSGSTSGEQSSTHFSTFGSFSADRTTDNWHLRFFTHGSYSEGLYTFSDGSKLTSYVNAYDALALVVKSEGPHVSLGFIGSLHSSTVQNQSRSLRLAPAVEYSLFPYSQAQRRQLTAMYSLGVTDVRYDAITIYDKLTETLFDQSLLVSYDLTQPWGSFNLSLAGNQYLHDLSKYSVTGSVSGDFRLFRGFALSVSADASRVKNQLYLPRGAATDEQVLLNLRQLATSYRYSGRLGLSYTFGSIFNNIVNPRLGQ
ncbi:MAG: hypothetical protein ACYCVL_07080 [Gemmatimonadaceae bacterium]